jgi:hypothetical protein
MSCSGNSDCTCGCCAGITVQTPRGETNRAGLSAIAYRTGTWATFRSSMLARLSSSDYPALAGLTTRAADDASIALLDASALVLDILTFYQERLANESYLRTATQLYSLTQLCQLIGYQPSPGVSASVYLAFTLTAAPGSPTNPTTTAITVPAGTTVQSVPPQGQTPQAFQTSADIVAKPDWNALPVQTGNPWVAGALPSVYLQGTATQLQPGDAFLVVGDTGASDPTTQPWYVGIVNSVQPDTVNQRTLVSWLAPGLGSSGSLSSGIPTFYALRQRAALFGYNAINPLMLTKKARAALGSLLTTATPPDWAYLSESTTQVQQSLIDLDAVYPKVVPPGWLVMVAQGDGSASVLPVSVQTVLSTTRSDFGMSAKITRVGLVPPQNPFAQIFFGLAIEGYYFNTRTTSLFLQSEALTIAEQPLDHPLYGTLLDLEVVREDLVGITAVAITGKQQTLTVNAGSLLSFQPYDNSAPVMLAPGALLTLLQPPPTTFNKGVIPSWAGSDEVVTLVVSDASGRAGTLSASLSNFTLAVAASSSAQIQEVALVASVTLVNATGASTIPVRTEIVLQTALQNCYDRTLTTVNANVGIATAGRAVTELLGNGSAATPNQSFKLKQAPLTYVQSNTPSGSQSSLKVTANGAAWTAVPTLYDQAPNAQVFATVNLTGGGAQVQFGDGVEGATLPTGQNNIVANYRIGIGSAGNVAASAISTLVDRPVGVKGVNNPMASTGGQDPQSIDGIRVNAPQTVLTLGRAVSITDYQNFAATFAGIAKAFALWIPNGVNCGVFLTVAASGGVALTPPNLTLGNLVLALQTYGNPHVAVRAQTFIETLFGLDADIAYDPAYDVDAVNANVLAVLTSTYSFAARTFGQGVSSDEIAALIQGVAGVIAVNVTNLSLGPSSTAGDLGSVGYSLAAWNNWIQDVIQPLPRPAGTTGSTGTSTIIYPYVPVATLGALPPAAEILVLNPNPLMVNLGVMT